MEATPLFDRPGSRLRLRVLGGFSLERPGEEAVAIANRKACALLAYLALRPDRSDTRERLAGLLWSDRGEEHARASLRQCLKKLRKLFDDIGFGGFHAERHNVTLDGDIEIDLFDLKSQLAGNTVADSLISGEASPDGILYGYETLDEAFGSWLQLMRRNWQDRLVGDLQALMQRGSTEIARRAAEALVAIDPTHEEAQRYVIRYLADRGNTTAAIKQYNQLWELLGDEYDMEPAKETQALIAEVKSGTYVPKSGSLVPETRYRGTTVPSPVRLEVARSIETPTRTPIIGISRFMPGGPLASENYMIEGFRRELVATMIRFREWIVVEGDTLSPSDWETGHARTSDQRRVDFQVEGTYYEQDDTVHQIITLKDSASHRYVWSERIALTIENWFTAQQEIVRRVSVALNLYLSTDRLTRLVSQQSFEPEIYDKWLQGQQQLSHWNPDAERSAENSFKEIIRSAPDFAPAYSSLAAIYNSRHFKHPGLLRTREDASNALTCARQSVKLDPLDTRSQLSLAWSNAMHDRFDQAELHFNLTYELNANSPITLIPSAHGLSFCGNHALANDLAETAIRLTPGMPGFHWGYVMCIRYLNQDFAGALEAAEVSQDAITDLHAWKAAALAHAGYLREAVETANQFKLLARKRWSVSDPCSDERIVQWFLQSFPIKYREDRQLLTEGLALAGLPVTLQ